MKFDLTGLARKTNEEVKEAEQRASYNSENRVPLLYPAENGTFRIKLLYNPKGDCTQKKICRHTIAKEKFVCLAQSYGEDCPICNAIKTVEESKGKDCGVYKKYGAKKRGIAYAVLVSHEDRMLKENNSPKDKDLIMFMYPETIYNAINTELNKSIDKLSEILVDNESYTFEISRSIGSNGFPKYEAKVYPYGKEKVFETSDEMDKLIDGLPNLNEQITPESIDKVPEETLQKIKAAADTIKKEYFINNILDPTTPPESTSTSVESNSTSGAAIFEEIIGNPEVPF